MGYFSTLVPNHGYGAIVDTRRCQSPLLFHEGMFKVTESVKAPYFWVCWASEGLDSLFCSSSGNIQTIDINNNILHFVSIDNVVPFSVHYMVIRRIVLVFRPLLSTINFAPHAIMVSYQLEPSSFGSGS